MQTVKILESNVSDTTKREVLEFIVKSLAQKRKKIAIFTPNPEIIVFAHKNKAFRAILNSADLALPDGIGVMWAATVLGKQLRQRITGVDFMEMLCKEASIRAFTVGLFGGEPKIAERAAECLRQLWPKIKITIFGEDFFEKKELQDTSNDKKMHVDILFVALGFPKQEIWIHEHLSKIPVRVAMAVGGSFDYISGAVPRAPLFMRRFGLEWLFRLIVQPWRLARQVALIHFIVLIFKTKFFPSAKST